MTGFELLLRLVIYHFITRVKKLKLFKKIKIRMIYKNEADRIKKYGQRWR